MNDYERRVLANVRKYGWHCTSVSCELGDAEPRFSYTVGLFHTHRQPEFIIFGLDAGIARLGPVPALQLFAIELELMRSRVDPALARLDTVAAQSPRQETWLARRGDILAQAGRRTEARSAYAAALAAIEALPAGARQTKAVIELEGQVRSALARR